VPDESPAFVSEAETSASESETETSVSETAETVTEVEPVETQPAEILHDIAEPNKVNFWSVVKPYLLKLPHMTIIPCVVAFIGILICFKALKSSQSRKVGSYKTDADGKALVTGIADGTYTIYETAAPGGYYPNETAKTVTVSGGVVSAEFFARPLSGLLIRKIDSDTGQPVAGALFIITGADGEFIGVYATDGDGVIFIPELTEGNYIVKEVKTTDSG